MRKFLMVLALCCAGGAQAASDAAKPRSFEYVFVNADSLEILSAPGRDTLDLSGLQSLTYLPTHGFLVISHFELFNIPGTANARMQDGTQWLVNHRSSSSFPAIVLRGGKDVGDAASGVVKLSPGASMSLGQGHVRTPTAGDVPLIGGQIVLSRDTQLIDSGGMVLTTTTAVPEPSAYLMFGSGLLLLLRRRF